MSNFTDFISGGGGGTLYTIPITASTTWTPPYNGTAVIHCIGAGGSGGTDQGNGNVTGGGAGGYSRKVVTLSTGTNWTMVVGAGGAPTTSNEANGNAGGNTTATDGSSSLAANGGGAGLTNSTAAVAGGSASGGDVNNTGGAGGHNGTMCGGGAVGVLGTGDAGEVGTGAMSGGATIYKYGGHSDVQSPQFENTNGELRGGGRGGKFENVWVYGKFQINDGGFLAGGGASWCVTAEVTASGGDGGIGGGGGSANCRTASQAGYINSGKGGDGLIIVMYTSVG
jgi:hypothetical protein